MISYPFESTPDGDLKVLGNAQNLIESRIRMVIDLQPGDRPLLPEFGSRIEQFAPTAGIASLNAELLKESLTRWAVSDLTAAVAVEVAQSTTGRYLYKVSHE